MCIQELSTCLQYNTPIKIVSLNNRYLGMVRQWQELDYEGPLQPQLHGRAAQLRQAGRGLWPCRHADRAPAGRRAGAARSRKLKDRTVFMDFRTDPTENVFPMVKAGKGITEMLLGPRRSVAKNLACQPSESG
jgi:acetolactate synthase-1/2/3 large subunit